MSTRLTKNCDVALCGSLVRAIDSVPRRFFRPLSASFLIGLPRRLLLHVGGHAAALDDEAGDDAVKDGAVEMAGVDVVEEVLRGDRRVLLEQFNGEVAERGFESDHGGRPGKCEKRAGIVNVRRLDVTPRPRSTGQAAFGAPVEPGEVAVVVALDEPGALQQATNGPALACRRARRSDQPPGMQVCGRGRRHDLQGFETGRPGIQRRVRFEPADVALDARVVVGDVRADC